MNKNELQPLSVASLRRHFIEIYRLSADQADLMVDSACRSLRESLHAGTTALARGDRGELAGCAHNLKGVFLNIGERDWAEVARRLENVANGIAEGDEQLLLQRLHESISTLPSL